MKRTIVLVCIVIASLGGLLILSPLVRNAAVQENAAVATIPTDALLIARINSWNELLEQQRSLDTLWSILGSSLPGHLMQRLARAFDSLRVENPDLLGPVAPGESAMSWHSMGQKTLSSLAVIQLTSNVVKPEEVMGALFPRAIPIASQVYAGTKIVSFTFDERSNAQTWHAASKENLCYLSTSRILLENALRMASAEHNLLHEAAFARVLQSSSRNVPWNAFLQLPRYSPYMASQLNGVWKRLVAETAKWCTWIGLDVSQEGLALSVQGLSAVERESKNLSNKYADAKSSVVSSPSILPETCPVFLRWGDRNSERLHTQLSAQLGISAELSQTLIARAEIQEVTLAWDEQNGSGNWLLVLAPRSTSHAFGTLRSELDGFEAHENLHTLRIDKDEELTIATSTHPDYFQKHFGTPFPSDVGKYYAVVDRYIVFASTTNALERVALAKLRGTTLENSPAWKEVKEQLQSQCNFMYYSVPNQRKDFASLFFSTQNALRSGRGARLVNSLAGLVIQVSGADKILFYNGIFQQSEAKPHSSVSTGWETRLDASIKGRPLFVSNHNTKAQEVLLQDENGKLYLLNAEGRILWRAQLEGEILGSPRQVDLYRNNKLQYVFCTKNKLYAVDRNGNMVDGFPVRLPAETFAPLAIFDYEGKRDYRFVVSCANRRIYMYDRTGRRVEGFAPPQMETSTNHPLVWFSSRDKDYIVACDSSRLYFLNRRGEERLRTKSSVSRAYGAPLSVEFGNSPRIVTVSEEGDLCVISAADGDVRRIAIPSWRSASTGMLTDLNGDGVLELVYTRGKELIAVNQLGNIVYRTTFDGELGNWLQTFRFSEQDVRVGIFSPSLQRIWLVNASGNVSAGYPLEGNSPFSIGAFVRGQGVFNLLVGKGNALKNYEVKP